MSDYSDHIDNRAYYPPDSETVKLLFGDVWLAVYRRTERGKHAVDASKPDLRLVGQVLGMSRPKIFRLASQRSVNAKSGRYTLTFAEMILIRSIVLELPVDLRRVFISKSGHTVMRSI